MYEATIIHAGGRSNPQDLPTDTNNSFREGMLSFTEGK